MAVMNPILRLRRAFRSMGVESEQAEDAADAIGAHSYSRSESDLHYQRMMADMERFMERMQNRIILAVLAIAALTVTALTAIMAAFD